MALVLNLIYFKFTIYHLLSLFRILIIMCIFRRIHPFFFLCTNLLTSLYSSSTLSKGCYCSCCVIISIRIPLHSLSSHRSVSVLVLFNHRHLIEMHHKLLRILQNRLIQILLLSHLIVLILIHIMFSSN